MSNEIVRVKTSDIVYQELKEFSTDQLRTELQTALTMSAAAINRLAAIVRLLEERGEDLSQFRMGLIGHLRKIAFGHLLPDVVVKYSSYPLLINKISALPIEDQKSLVERGSVPLAVSTNDNILADPMKLSAEQIRRVFDKDRVRSIDEQKELLQVRTRAIKQIVPKADGTLRPDHARGGLIFGRTFFSSDDILNALASLNNEPEETGETNTVVLDSAQVRCLKIQAAKRDTTIKTLIVRACRACGLLTE